MTITSLRLSARLKRFFIGALLLILVVPTVVATAQQGSEQEARKKEEKERMESEQLTPEQIQERKIKIGLELKARTKRQIELAKMAKISMEQAIQIASTQQPGTAVECSLIHERDTAFYRVLLVSGDETNPASAYVFVNAVDGSIGSFPNAGQVFAFTGEDGKTRSVVVRPGN